MNKLTTQTASTLDTNTGHHHRKNVDKHCYNIYINKSSQVGKELREDYFHADVEFLFRSQVQNQRYKQPSEDGIQQGKEFY